MGDTIATAMAKSLLIPYCVGEGRWREENRKEGKGVTSLGRVRKCGKSSDYLILSVGVVDHDIEQLQEVSNQIHKQYHVVRFEAPICTPQGAAGEGGREGGGDGRVSEGWVY